MDNSLRHRAVTEPPSLNDLATAVAKAAEEMKQANLELSDLNKRTVSAQNYVHEKSKALKSATDELTAQLKKIENER